MLPRRVGFPWTADDDRARRYRDGQEETKATILTDLLGREGLSDDWIHM